MADIIDILKYTVSNQLHDNGVKIFVKTDLGKEILVYDAAAPVNQTTGETNNLIKVGISVRDKNGNVITNYGGNPKTNYFKVAAVVAPILIVGFLTLRGIIK